MIDLSNINKIYLAPGTTDLRLGIDGYSMIIQGAFHKNPFDKSLYIFCNKAHNKLKILHFEDTGFWLYYKRIETGTVKWPKDINDLKEINFKQFNWLLDGLKIDQKALKKCNASKAY